MTKHTPGPWGHSKLGNNADQWGIYDKSGRTIGLSYHGEANAIMFATAPELLRALEIMERAFNQKEINPLIAFASIEKALATIKAATGEP